MQNLDRARRLNVHNQIAAPSRERQNPSVIGNASQLESVRELNCRKRAQLATSTMNAIPWII